MEINDLISDERKIELDKELEKEIQDLKNNKICKRKFIFYIKKYSFIEFCYLYSIYIGTTEEKPKLLTSLNDFVFVTEAEDYYYNVSKRTMTYKIQDVKRIKRVENMALRGKKVKKRSKKSHVSVINKYWTRCKVR